MPSRESKVLRYLKHNDIRHHHLISYLSSNHKVPKTIQSEIDRQFLLFFVLATRATVAINEIPREGELLYRCCLEYEPIEYENLCHLWEGELPPGVEQNVVLDVGVYDQTGAMPVNNVYLLFGPSNKRILKHIKYHRSLTFTDSHQNLHAFKKMVPATLFHHIIVISSSVLAVIGVTSARDVDAYLYNPSDNPDHDKAWDRFKRHEQFDIKIFHKGHWERQSQKDYYLGNWLNSEWPHLVGARDFEDLLYNPSHHFVYRGVKFISLEATIERIKKRVRYTSYVDLLGIRDVLKIPVDIPCLPSYRFARGSIALISEDEKKIMIGKIKRAAREWYEIRMSTDAIAKLLTPCSHSKYKDTQLDHTAFRNLKDFHKRVKREYVMRYACPYLIDIGSGRLHSIGNWIEAGVRRVLAVEPSIDSVRKAKRIAYFNRDKIKVDIQNTTGDAPWRSRHQAGLVTFEFSFHYLIPRLDAVMDNLTRFCKHGGHVVIHTMIGDSVRWFTRNGAYNVYDAQGVEVFRLTRAGENNVNVWMNRIYGLAHEIEESIVDIDYLVERFTSAHFKLVEYRKFLEQPFIEEYPLQKYELSVSQLYITLVFQRIS